MKTDYINAKILSHRANLQRYFRLLATQLTELEREYLHKRIAEERTEVSRLELLQAGKQRSQTRMPAQPILRSTERALPSVTQAYDFHH